MNSRWMIPALAALALQTAPAAGAAQVTVGSSPGVSNYNSFGTLGQTFTVPWESSVLSEFSFWVSPYYNPTGSEGEHVALRPPVFRLFVMGWDEALFAPTGDVLFRSEARTGRTVTDGWAGAEYAFDTGSLDLGAGGMYVAFLSTRDDPQPGPVCVSGRCYQSVNRMDMYTFPPSYSETPYDGGAMVGLDYTTEYGGASPPGRWSRPIGAGGEADARFSATFETTAAPEPASMALLGTGLAGLAGAARRRRRRRDEQAAADSGS